MSAGDERRAQLDEVRASIRASTAAYAGQRADVLKIVGVVELLSAGRSDDLAEATRLLVQEVKNLLAANHTLAGLCGSLVALGDALIEEVETLRAIGDE